MLKLPLVNRTVPTSRAIKDTFVLYKGISKQYDDPDILNYVRNLVPGKLVSDTEVRDTDQRLRLVLQWFKKDFMRWIPKDPKCKKCNKPMIAQSIKGNSWKLRSMETYTCNNCFSLQVFLRYGEIIKIAESRTGRCSEWSMLFGAILNSLYIETRIVHDYLDHCWNESLIDGKCVHIDSTLDYPISFNHPYYYEQNWDKKYSYVLAFSSDSLEDVTKRYTQQWDLVQQRRKNSARSAKEYADIYSRI
jgi:peptide-N4-(N-acetyl-beta-glucosaminyl)asparagine amidase